MERHFDECLTELKRELIRMSALAERMIADAMRVLVRRDAGAAALVYRHEEEVNRMQMEVDEICLRLIALHQPAAMDLRFILGASKTNTDLERLADQAVNICQKAEHLMKNPPLKEFEIIPRMAETAAGMLRDSLHAYVNRDPGKAREIIARDKALNEDKRLVTAEMVAIMETEPQKASCAMDITLVAHNIERIGDHAKNIAENAIFVAEGKDIRHGAERKPCSGSAG